jgi:hypothetical protein
MTSYRFYWLNADGYFRRGEHRDCSDDLDALKQAKAAADDYGLEVWQDARYVTRVMARNGVQPRSGSASR